VEFTIEWNTDFRYKRLPFFLPVAPQFEPDAMSLRHHFAFAAILCAAMVCGATTSYAQIGLAVSDTTSSDAPEDPAIVRARFIEYERQLNAMLKTRRDEEKQFVAEVINQIRLEKIPSKLVTTSFEWVRNKRPDTEYPFVYFERVLRLQAKRLQLGNEIPAFDYRIYSQPIDPVVRDETVGNEAATLDNTASERNGGFNFFRRAFTRVVPSELTGGETPRTDNAESERNGGGGIFRLGSLIDRLRR
jgi:hypothetical protein